ncbi:solute carrier family 35 member G1 [Gracilaria domingensis]|nr:solute carrier family 35 member G1 [Gracilaria domingensis]
METQPLLSCRTKVSQSSTPSATHSHTAVYGLAWITLSAVLIAVPTVAARLAVIRYDFHVIAIAFLRCFVQLALSSISLLAVIKVSPVDLSLTHKIVLFMRGICGSMALVLVYVSVAYLPAGVVSAITAFSPVLTMVLSWMFLKETSSVWDIMCALFGICGVLLITGPNASKQDILGVVLAFLSACFAAAAYVCVRYMGTHVHFMLSVFAIGAVCVPATAIYGGKEMFRQIVHNHEGVAVGASVVQGWGRYHYEKRSSAVGIRVGHDSFARRTKLRENHGIYACGFCGDHGWLAAADNEQDAKIQGLSKSCGGRTSLCFGLADVVRK